MSIGRDDMFAPILEAFPGFEQTYREFLDDWQGDADKPYYLAIIDLIVCLVENVADRDTSHFPRVFEVVERWLIEGDHYVREAAVVGLLEGLQNTNHHKRGTAPTDFLPYLAEETRYWWDRVEHYLATGESMKDHRILH